MEPIFTRVHNCPIFVVAIFAVLLASCQQPASKFTAEEAAYNESIIPIINTACQIGTMVSVPKEVPCGVFDPCEFGDTMTVYEDFFVMSLELPDYGREEGMHPWSEKYAELDSLLPPPGNENLHSAIVAMLAAQMRLPKDYPKRIEISYGSKPPEAEHSLLIPAQNACKAYNEFAKLVDTRPEPTIETTSSAALSVSFQPMGTPVSMSLSSTGSFSVSVSPSIATPIGTVSLSASDSTGTPMHPTRLVINAFDHRRVLLMDRPFKAFVPSQYGVSVSNDGHQLTLDVLGPPPKVHRKLRSKAELP